MRGCFSCVKYAFFFFNFLFWVLGALALGVGIWAVADAGFEAKVDDALKSVDQLNVSMLKQAAYLMIVAGAVMMVIGFFGCFGAIRESQCMLVVFFVLLFLVLALCVAIVVILFVEPHLTDSVTKPIFEKLVETYKAGNSSLELIQPALKCCGAEGRDDYAKYEKSIPESCKDFKNGCVHALHDQLEQSFAKYPVETGAVTAAVLFLIVVGMGLAISLCCVIRAEDQPEEFKVV